MRKFSWYYWVAILLVILSIAIYIIHFLIFRDVHHIFIYMIGDLAFLPIEVLLVILVIHRLLTEREKRMRLEKLNMVIDAFFSEVGTDLLRSFKKVDHNISQLKKYFVVKPDTSDRGFMEIREILDGYQPDVTCSAADLEELKAFLLEKRDFMLRLLENPHLLENELFTDMLKSIFHLMEELVNRENLGKVTGLDMEHICGDVKRASIFLIRQWIEYMMHLKNSYPYLYSLAVRLNPFDPDASPEIK